MKPCLGAGGLLAFALACLPARAGIPPLAAGVQLMDGASPIMVDIGCAVPTVADWNNDGRKDLIVGQYGNGNIRLYLNGGTDTNPVFNGYSWIMANGRAISVSYG
jgi:hypothetical protein